MSHATAALLEGVAFTVDADRGAATAGLADRAPHQEPAVVLGRVGAARDDAVRVREARAVLRGVAPEAPRVECLTLPAHDLLDRRCCRGS